MGSKWTNLYQELYWSFWKYIIEILVTFSLFRSSNILETETANFTPVLHFSGNKSQKFRLLEIDLETTTLVYSFGPESLKLPVFSKLATFKLTNISINQTEDDTTEDIPVSKNTATQASKTILSRNQKQTKNRGVLTSPIEFDNRAIKSREVVTKTIVQSPYHVPTGLVVLVNQNSYFLFVLEKSAV